MIDKWAKLWNYATCDCDGDAVIIPDPDDPNEVTLRWPDGSESRLYWCWATNQWEHHESISGCPGDVAARDTL